MGVPNDDEDWPDRLWMHQHFLGMSQSALIGFLKNLPCKDEIHFFDSLEQGIMLGVKTMKDVLPVATETFPDLVSDDAMSLIAFWGLGQVFLQGKGSKDKPKDGFQCDVSFLFDFPVRDGFEK